MKSITLLTAASLLASAHAWTFTYRNAGGKASTVSGEGPHPCIEVDNEEGQVFELDGQGEKNINMLMFTTPDCSGKAAGMATESFSKKASVTIRGFKVVSTADGGSGGSNNSSATHTGTAPSAGNATVTSGPSPPGKTVTLSDAATSTASAAETAATGATTTPATTAAGASGASGASSTAASASPSGTASGDSGAVALAGSSVKVLGGVVVGLVTFGWLL